MAGACLALRRRAYAYCTAVSFAHVSLAEDYSCSRQETQNAVFSSFSFAHLRNSEQLFASFSFILEPTRSVQRLCGAFYGRRAVYTFIFLDYWRMATSCSDARASCAMIVRTARTVRRFQSQSPPLYVVRLLSSSSLCGSSLQLLRN